MLMKNFTKIFFFIFGLGLFISAASGIQWGTEEAGTAVTLSAAAGFVVALFHELIVG